MNSRMRICSPPHSRYVTSALCYILQRGEPRYTRKDVTLLLLPRLFAIYCREASPGTVEKTLLFSCYLGPQIYYALIRYANIRFLGFRVLLDLVICIWQY